MFDDHMCAICQAPLRELSDHTSLECGHTCHTHCISTYCSSQNASLTTIECQVCKRTALQMRTASHTAIDLDNPNAQTHPSSLESNLEMLSPTLVWNGPSSPDATQPPPAASSSPDGTQPPQAALKAPTVAPSSSDAPPSPATSDALALLVPAPSPAGDQSTVAGSYPASDVPITRRPQFASFDVFCGMCGSNVHADRARCRGKFKQIWACSKCEVKTTQLRRAFGRWPVDSFTKMTKEDQQQFFRDCKGMRARELLNKNKRCDAHHRGRRGAILSERGQFSTARNMGDERIRPSGDPIAVRGL